MIKLSLIIPCYNEAATLPALIDACQKEYHDKPVEIILVDNGSSDDTSQLLATLLANQQIIRAIRVENNQGYGHGILAGLEAARGEVLAWTHADMQAPPEDAWRGYQQFFQQQSIANLFVKGVRYKRRLFDRSLAIGMSIFETLLLQKPLWEINAQPTMMHRSLFEQWQDPPTDYSLDLYAYYTAKVYGYQIKRFPVYFGPRLHGHSHWNRGLASMIKFIKRTMTYSFALRKQVNKMPRKQSLQSDL